MFHAIWEFALSADSITPSRDPQKVQRFFKDAQKAQRRLGIPKKRSAFWKVTIESQNQLATLDNLII